MNIHHLITDHIDRKVKRFYRAYLAQSLLAALVLFLVLFLENAPARGALIAALGSTAFVLFMMPDRAAAQPRHAVGGHMIALLVGGAIAALDGTATGQRLLTEMPILLNVQGALAVGLAIFLMVATDTEHAPAAGTALGMVMQPFSWGLVFFMASSVAALSLAHRLLRPWLRNLL